MATPLQKPDIVIFDMDGTTVRHVNPLLLSCLEFLDNAIYAVARLFSRKKEITDFSHDPAAPRGMLVHRMLHKFRRKPVEQIVQPCPGIYLLLNYLRDQNVRLAIASNGLGKGYGHDILQKFKLEQYFEQQIFREDVSKSKPHPDGILRVLNLMDNTPEPGDVLSVSDADEAQVTIEAFDAGVVATKSISADTDATESSPAVQYDGSSTTATVTLQGRPTGNVRYTDMIIEDTSPTFWNAYVFTGFESHAFASPINRVQVDALVDVDYAEGSGNTITSTGGTWVLGTTGTTLALPAGVDPADVRGLRFTYTRSDFSTWERPSNPQQSVRFTVERRDDLLTGGPVPSTLYIYDTGIAPGETDRATFTNEVDVTVNAREAADAPAVWTANDSDAKQLRFEHLPAKVEIRKSPAGAVFLGDSIDFAIEVTNFGGDGDRVLSGLVVTDLLPVDEAGDPYLVFPENPDSDEAYDPNDPADAAVDAGSPAGVEHLYWPATISFITSAA